MSSKWLSIIVLLISVQCMGQKDFDEKLNSILDKSVPFMSTEQLSKNYQDGNKILTLDAREDKEYQVSHIPGAVLVGYDDFDIDKVEQYDKDQPVVVYCSVGYRSEKIGEALEEAGFKNVFNLYGGIFKWKNDGHEVVDMQGVATDSVHTYNKNWSQWLTNGVKVYE